MCSQFYGSLRSSSSEEDSSSGSGQSVPQVNESGMQRYCTDDHHHQQQQPCVALVADPSPGHQQPPQLCLSSSHSCSKEEDATGSGNEEPESQTQGHCTDHHQQQQHPPISPVVDPTPSGYCREMNYILQGLQHFQCGIHYARAGNFAAAFREWRIACDFSYPPAFYQLGNCYRQGKGVEQNFEKAKKYFKEGAKKGDLKSAYNYAVMILKENSFEAGRRKSWIYLQQASDANIDKACSLLGVLNMEIEQHHEAAGLFKKACAKQPPDPLAQYYLGICMEREIGIEKNTIKAAELYVKAAEAGVAYAQHNLAVFYENGHGGLEKDISTAMRWYESAARAGVEDSRRELNRLQLNGDADEKQSSSKNDKSVAHTLADVQRPETALSSGFSSS